MGGAHQCQTAPVRNMNFNNEVSVAAKRQPEMQRSSDLQSEGEESCLKSVDKLPETCVQKSQQHKWL